MPEENETSEENPQEDEEEEDTDYARRAQEWRTRLARKRFGTAQKKGWGQTASNAITTKTQATKAALQGALTAARTAIVATATSVGWPALILVAILILVVIIAIVFWAYWAGLGKYTGQTPHRQITPKTITELLAYSGDPAAIRKLIVEKGDQLITEFTDVKSQIDKVPNTEKAKKEEAKKKIDEMIVLITQAKELLGGETGQLSTAAREKIKQIQGKLGEIKKIFNMMSLSANGDLVLPLGVLTCITKNNTRPHTLKPSGHGVFIKGGLGATDYHAPIGTVVYSAVDGEVIKRGFQKQYQNWFLIIESEDKKYKFTYAHIQTPLDVGAKVTAGQALGTVLPCKNTSSPVHLHFELWVDGKPIGEKEQKAYLCGK